MDWLRLGIVLSAIFGYISAQQGYNYPPPDTPFSDSATGGRPSSFPSSGGLPTPSGPGATQTSPSKGTISGYPAQQGGSTTGYPEPSRPTGSPFPGNFSSGGRPGTFPPTSGSSTESGSGSPFSGIPSDSQGLSGGYPGQQGSGISTAGYPTPSRPTGSTFPGVSSSGGRPGAFPLTGGFPTTSDSDRSQTSPSGGQQGPGGSIGPSKPTVSQGTSGAQRPPSSFTGQQESGSFSNGYPGVGSPQSPSGTQRPSVAFPGQQRPSGPSTGFPGGQGYSYPSPDKPFAGGSPDNRPGSFATPSGSGEQQTGYPSGKPDEAQRPFGTAGSSYSRPGVTHDSSSQPERPGQQFPTGVVQGSTGPSTGYPSSGTPLRGQGAIGSQSDRGYPGQFLPGGVQRPSTPSGGQGFPEQGSGGYSGDGRPQFPSSGVQRPFTPSGGQTSPGQQGPGGYSKPETPTGSVFANGGAQTATRPSGGYFTSSPTSPDQQSPSGYPESRITAGSQFPPAGSSQGLSGQSHVPPRQPATGGFATTGRPISSQFPQTDSSSTGLPNKAGISPSPFGQPGRPQTEYGTPSIPFGGAGGLGGRPTDSRYPSGGQQGPNKQQGSQFSSSPGRPAAAGPSGQTGGPQTEYKVPSGFPGRPGRPQGSSGIHQDFGSPSSPQGGFFGQQRPQENGPNESEAEGQFEDGDYSAIPGEPEIDYPILKFVPDTSFRCEDQQYPGYYADVETRCQVFHICANNKTYDFLCPNGTIFHQEYLVCVWWNQFDCNSAPSFYGVNENIYDFSIIGAQQTGGIPVEGSGYPTSPQGGFSSGQSQIPSFPSIGGGVVPGTKPQAPDGYPSRGFGTGSERYPSGGSETQRPEGYFSGRPQRPGSQESGKYPSAGTQEVGNDLPIPGGYPSGRPQGLGFPLRPEGSQAPGSQPQRPGQYPSGGQQGLGTGYQRPGGEQQGSGYEKPGGERPQGSSFPLRPVGSKVPESQPQRPGQFPNGGQDFETGYQRPGGEQQGPEREKPEGYPSGKPQGPGFPLRPGGSKIPENQPQRPGQYPNGGQQGFGNGYKTPGGEQGSGREKPEGYPSERPQGSGFPSGPGGSQTSGVGAQRPGGYPSFPESGAPDRYPSQGTQSSGVPQISNGYPSGGTQRPGVGSQLPGGYPSGGQQRPSFPLESGATQVPGGYPNGAQGPGTGSQGLGGYPKGDEQRPNGETQGSGVGAQKPGGYPNGRPQGPSFPSGPSRPETPGISSQRPSGAQQGLSGFPSRPGTSPFPGSPQPHEPTREYLPPVNRK